MQHIDSLPPNLRSGLARALTARGRDASFLASNGTPETSPIIGGRDAPDYKYPWYARMIYFYYDMPYWVWCGASVYNARTIITAAHCVDVDPEQAEGFIAVHTGNYDPSKEEVLEQITLVDNIIVHQHYRGSGAFLLIDDIALMITDTALNFTTIAVRPLPSLSTRRKDEMALRSNNCVAIGFGVFVLRPGVWVPDVLQELTPLNLVSNRECHNHLWMYEYSVTPKMIGALGQHATTCSGDSGGPVGCYDNKGVYYQVGIVSWGDCETVTVYTRVSKYRRWIEFHSYRV